MPPLSHFIGFMALSVVALGGPNEEEEPELISLARARNELTAASNSNLEQKAEVANMKGSLMANEQKISQAKLQLEALAKEEELQTSVADEKSSKVRKMEAAEKKHGGLSERARQANTNTVKVQDAMLRRQQELHDIREEIRSGTQKLKADQDAIIRAEKKTDEYREGTKLSMMKVTDLQSQLDREHNVLQQLKANLTRPKDKHKKKKNLRVQDKDRNKGKDKGKQSPDVSTQIAKVEKEVEKTKKKITELRDNEKEKADTNNAKLVSERKKTEEQKKDVETQLSNANIDKENMLTEQNRVVEQAKAASVKFGEFDIQQYEFHRHQEKFAELHALKSQLVVAQEKVKNLEAQKEELRRSKDDHESQKRKEIQSLQEAEKSEEEHEEARMKSLKDDEEHEHGDDEKRIETLQSDTKDYQQQKEAAHTQKMAVRAQMDRLQQRLHAANDRLSSVGHRVENMQKEVKKRILAEMPEGEIDTEETVTALRDEYNTVRERRKSKVSDLSKQVAKLREFEEQSPKSSK